MAGFKKNAKPYKTGKRTTRKPARRRTPSAWSSAKNLAVKALKGFRYLKGMINCEKHFSDTNVAALQSWSGTVTPLSALSQGDNIGNRIGDSILAKYLNLRYSWIMDTVLSSTICRLIIFQDTMSLGTIPSASDVLAVTGSAPAVLSLLNLQYAVQGRFKVLYDKTVSLNNYGGVAYATDEIIPINDHIKYTSTAGTDEGRNMLYALSICNVNANDPTLTMTARLAYYDN